ncbi:MAG: exopolysaccharide transport family protein [Hyphomicrobiales bacterium]|nr:exopolysaccharide transport family protein [Hyphomicrobiales bacterium]
MIRGSEPSAQNFVAEGEVESVALGQALWARRRMILGWTLGALLASTAVVNVLKTRYTGEAGVVIESQANFFTSAANASGANPLQPPDAEDVATQVEVIKSRDLAIAAIKKLHLVGNPEFDPLAGSQGLLSRLEILLRLKRDPSQMTREDGIIDNFAKALTVFSPTKTRFLNIDFSAHDPKLAAAGANVVAELFMERQGAAKKMQAKVAADALRARLDDLRQKLAEAESKAEDFRLKNNLVSGRNSTNMSTQQLEDLNSQLSKARLEESDASAKAQMIRQMVKTGRIGDVSDVVNSNLVRRIYEQRVTVSAQLAQQSRTLLPGHPVIKALQAQLADINRQLAEAARKTAVGLENEARLAALKVANLRIALSQQTQVAGQASSAEVELRKLTDNASLIRKTLETDTATYQEQEARAEATATPVDARMVSRAAVPQTPSFPKKIPMVVVATLAGFVFSAGSVLARELLKVPAAPWHEDEAEPDEIMMAETARRRRREPLPPVPDDRQVAEAASALAGHEIAGAAAPLAQADATPAPKPAPGLALLGLPEVVARLRSATSAHHAVISLLPALRAPGEEAKSEALSALALACPLAADARVLLVNLDAQSFEIDALADSDDALGFSELLAGEASYAEVIHRDSQSRLHVIGFGQGASGARGDLEEVLDVLGESYDHVLLFCRLQGEGINAAEVTPLADYVVMNEAERLEPAVAARFVARLVSWGAPIVLLARSAAPSSLPRQRGLA